MRAGGPNSNDSNSNKLLHHTIGLLDREQEMRCFQQVTCAQVTPSARERMRTLLQIPWATWPCNRPAYAAGLSKAGQADGPAMRAYHSQSYGRVRCWTRSDLIS